MPVVSDQQEELLLDIGLINISLPHLPLCPHAFTKEMPQLPTLIGNDLIS